MTIASVRKTFLAEAIQHHGQIALFRTTNSGLDQEDLCTPDTYRKRSRDFLWEGLQSTEFMAAPLCTVDSPAPQKKRTRPPSLCLTADMNVNTLAIDNQVTHSNSYLGEKVFCDAFENTVFEGQDYGGVARRGTRRNHKMEDRMCVAQEIGSDVHLFGVFDGHGGSFAADFVSKHIVSICRELCTLGKTLDTCLSDGLLAVDKSLCLEATCASEGCTAALVAKSPSSLVVANVGDSRVVVSSNGQVS